MTRQVLVGSVPVGGGAPVTIQSMTNTDTRDAQATVEQIHRLEAAGCEIVRSAVFDMNAARAVRDIVDRIDLPLVADVHFDYRLAIAAVENGCKKLRINPGNIGSPDRVKAVVDCCKAHHIPIRIGVNGGSLNKDSRSNHPDDPVAAMVESALDHVRLLENEGFYDTVISVKHSNVRYTVTAMRRLHELVDYPLHVGVTETGTEYMGTIKSAMGIGGLLCLGIGDTIRVSLTADPVKEVAAGKAILKAAGLRKEGVNIVSCPTCGRTRIDLIGLANRVEEALKDCKKPITVAVMGCVVNGPGEAREADYGIAGGKGRGLIFKKGVVLGTYPYEELCDRLIDLIESDGQEA